MATHRDPRLQKNISVTVRATDHAFLQGVAAAHGVTLYALTLAAMTNEIASLRAGKLPLVIQQRREAATADQT